MPIQPLYFPAGTVYGSGMMLVALCSGSTGDKVSLHGCLLYMTRSVPMDLAVNSPIDPGPNRSLYKPSALKEYDPRMFQ